MPEFKFNEFFQQARRVLAEMSLFKKAAILTVVGVSLSVLGFLWDLSGKAEYEVLFSNLKTEDISQIAGALDKHRKHLSGLCTFRENFRKATLILCNLDSGGIIRVGGGMEILNIPAYALWATIANAWGKPKRS